jgi:predicted amidohydrolase
MWDNEHMMKVSIAQLVVSSDVEENLKQILGVLEATEENTWVLFPEGMLSGYTPQNDDYIKAINGDALNVALDKVRAATRARKLYCLLGSALEIGGAWYNCTIFIGAQNEFVYRKTNLGAFDRNHFTQGDELHTYVDGDTTFGVQICRELVYPEQWKLLKKSGAQAIFHINNSIKEVDEVREHVLIARAFENQVWVCSVNNAAAPQKMRSMIIDPFGTVVWESDPQTSQVHSEVIDLTKDSNVYLGQERTDLVDIIAK